MFSKGQIDEDRVYNLMKIRDVSKKGHWGLGNIEIDIPRDVQTKHILEILIEHRK